MDTYINDLVALILTQQKLSAKDIESITVETDSESERQFVRVILNDDRVLIIPDIDRSLGFVFTDLDTTKTKVQAIRELSDAGYNAKEISEMLEINGGLNNGKDFTPQ